MSRYGQLLLDPRSPHFNEAVVEALSRLLQIVDNRIEFGNPHDPRSDTSVLLAGAGGHNGALQNIYGSFVELDVEALDTATSCQHNLSVPVAVAGEPNVLWTVMRWVHDGTAATSTSVPGVLFEEGDTVGTDSIQLRFYCSATRTVDADHPLKVTLFFTPAVRRP